MRTDSSLEGVTCGYQYPDKKNRRRELFALPLETEVVGAFETFFKLWSAHGFDGPASLMVTVLDVKNARIATGNDWRSPPWEEDIVIDRDMLVLPDVVVEDLSEDPRVLLRPTFDALWQASGYPRSLGYTAEGRWEEQMHRR